MQYTATKQASPLIRVYGLQPLSSAKKMTNPLLTKVSIFTGVESATGQSL